MAALTPGSILIVREGDEVHRLVTGDEDRGRVRGNELSLDDLDVTVQRTGERHELVTATGTPVLRFDPAGRKATTLTLSSGRFRLARQRPRPLLHTWLLTRGMHGDPVLRVQRTPLGTRVLVTDDTEVPGHELALLALGALVEVLALAPAPAAA